MSLTLEPFADAPSRIDRFLTRAEGLGRYTIEVSLPPGPVDPAARLPVIVVLDANLCFDMVHAVAHGRMAAAQPVIPPSILVGVGYPADEGFASFYARRNYDFHPAWDMTDPMGRLIETIHRMISRGEGESGTGIAAGGYDRFMRFLRDELLPGLAARYPIDLGARHTLVGDSSGGFFALRSLFDPGSPFRRVVAISPSFGAADGAIPKAEAAYAATHTDLDCDVFVCCGTAEMAPDRARALGRFGSAVTWLAETCAIREWPSARVHWEIMDHEDHGSIGPRAVAAGLRSVHRCRPGVHAEADAAGAAMLAALKAFETSRAGAE